MRLKKVLDYRLKNRYLVYFILSGFILGSFLGVYTHNITASYVRDEINWNEFQTGITSGEGSFYDFDSDGGEVALNSINGSTKSFKIDANSGGSSLTIDTNYESGSNCSSVSFWIEGNIAATYDKNRYMRFQMYDQNGNLAYKLYYYCVKIDSGSGCNKYRWYMKLYDSNQTAQEIVSCSDLYGIGQAEIEVIVTYVGEGTYGSQFNTQVLISGSSKYNAVMDGYIWGGGWEYTTKLYYKGGGSEDWTYYVGNIHINAESVSNNYYDTCSFNFYDKETGYPLLFYSGYFVGPEYSPSSEGGYMRAHILINDTIVNYLTAEGDFYYIKVGTSFDDGINDIFVYSPTSYGDYIYGAVEGVDVQWKTNYSVYLVDGGTTNIYLDRVGDPTIGSFDADDLIYYEGLYGSNIFLEFYNREFSGFYGVGDNPYIVYNLTYDLCTGVNTGLYFEIWKGADKLFGDKILINGVNLTGVAKVKNFVFNSDGLYYMKLYTFNDTTLIKGDLLYTSKTVDVEKKVVPPDQDAPLISDEYSMLIGIMVSLGVGVGLLLITGETLAMFFGSGVLVYLLSLDAMGDYQLFSSEVGIGIIVVLVLIAVVVWLLK